MDGKILRMQSASVLIALSVPPLLPVYDKYVSGVNRAGQLRKPYGFDRKLNSFGYVCFSVI